MRIYFIRHTESEANLLREHSNRGFRHPLTAKGREQAMALAKKLDGIPVARLYTSPLMRAVQTAEILSSVLGVSYEITDALREFDCGILEGHSDEAGWQMHFAVVHEWIEEGRWEQRIEGGESFLEIRDRFVPFVERLVQTWRDSQANVVLVGHGGLYRCMLPMVLENADYEFAAEIAVSYTEYVVAEARSEGLAWVEWGDQVRAGDERFDDG
jgi:probable phosphoglycerate mutase